MPHLARLHPGRIQEMQLHHVVDVPGGEPSGGLSRVIRWLAASPFADGLLFLLRSWPTRSQFRPLLPGVYQRLMNLAVLCAYRQGVTEPDA